MRAGELSWTDPESDAFPPAPGVSNGTLDIVKASLATTPTSFIWKTQLRQLGEPFPLATGHHFSLTFDFAGSSFIMRVTQDRLNGNGVVFEKSDPTAPTVENIGCSKCKFEVDAKTNTVTLTASLGTMQAASRKLVAGAKIEAVSVYAAPMQPTPAGTLYWGSDLGDTAPPPGDGTFTL